ncbi:MAG: hypothetical protein KDC26_10810 [Armatimonadetes bacterium]|nr:hypothetical protein [Armatimonadota bacterium]
MSEKKKLRFEIGLLLILVSSLLPFAGALFAGDGLGPFSYINEMMAGQSFTHDHNYDILQADGVLQFYPWRDLVFESWSRYTLPAWNPYQLGGTPLLANSQSAPLYPLHILMGVLLVPTLTAMVILAWFHCFVFGAGIFRLSERLGARKEAAIFAGMLASITPFFVMWSVLPSVITTCAWIPWVLVGLHRCWREGKNGLVLGASVAMMMLGGHLQFAFYGIFAALIFGVTLLIGSVREKEWLGKPLIHTGLAVLAGVMIAMPQVGATLAFSKYSHRQGSATAEGYQAYVAGAIKPWELVSFVIPYTVGNPLTKDQEATAEKGYWPMLVKPGGNRAESALIWGPAVLLGVALLRRKSWTTETIGIGAVGLLGLLLAMGTPVNALFYYGVPGFAATGSPGRAAVLFVLAGCVLASLGFSRLLDAIEVNEKAKYKPWIPGAITALVCLVTVSWAASLSGMGTWLEYPNFAVLVRSAAQQVMPMALISAVMILGMMAWRIKNPQALDGSKAWGPLIGLGLAQMIAFNVFSYLPHGKLEKIDLAEPNPDERHAFEMHEKPVWNFFRPPLRVIPPNIATLYRINDISGYDSLIHRDTVAMMKEINGGEDPAPPINGNMMLVRPSVDLKKLGAAGVESYWSVSEYYYVNGLPVPGEFSSKWQDHDPMAELRLTQEFRGLPQAKVESQDLRTARVSYSGDGTLTFRNRNMAGWSATVNGKPAAIKGERWLEVGVEGEGEVVFTYTPPNVLNPWLAFGIGLASLLTTSVFVGRTRAESTDHEKTSYNKLEPTHEPSNPGTDS